MTTELKPGTVVLHRKGGISVIKERKTAPDNYPHPGWWVQGGGGLADFVIDGDDFLILTPEVVKRIFEMEKPR
jgi:hypothetical protein